MLHHSGSTNRTNMMELFLNLDGTMTCKLTACISISLVVPETTYDQISDLRAVTDSKWDMDMRWILIQLRPIIGETKIRWHENCTGECYKLSPFEIMCMGSVSERRMVDIIVGIMRACAIVRVMCLSETELVRANQRDRNSEEMTKLNWKCWW